jgi:hypothetical protein
MPLRPDLDRGREILARHGASYSLVGPPGGPTRFSMTFAA